MVSPDSRPPARPSGRVARVSGPLVEVEGLATSRCPTWSVSARRRCPARWSASATRSCLVQAYEYTGGLAAGDPVDGPRPPAVGAARARDCSAASSTGCCARSRPRRPGCRRASHQARHTRRRGTGDRPWPRATRSARARYSARSRTPAASSTACSCRRRLAASSRPGAPTPGVRPSDAVVATVAGRPVGSARDGRCAARARCATGSTRPSRCSPANGCSTRCSRWPAAAAPRSRWLRHRQDDAAAADRQVVRRPT